ncbi:toxin-antitoxin system YwqK family antitoxin [Aquimarina aggregata]|uniref:hypothetical protein n=1 Tax=Aquimarina aggregata TaxID=1642818 RepID=UPI000A4EC704|nr:hypothetical protein [Aquimarina aggregata]
MILKTIFLPIISFTCFSQNSGKENLNLTFINQCTNEKVNPEFEILMPELSSKFTYEYITIFREIDDLITQYTTSIKTKTDTIYIPKILFAVGNELHSKRFNYLNCEKVCNGKETDFYKNGNKRTEGTYKNGKPIEIKDYRTSGTLRAQYFYENLTLNYKRIDYYDENEDLEEYQIYENKK